MAKKKRKKKSEQFAGLWDSVFIRPILAMYIGQLVVSTLWPLPKKHRKSPKSAQDADLGLSYYSKPFPYAESRPERPSAGKEASKRLERRS